MVLILISHHEEANEKNIFYHLLVNVICFDSNSSCTLVCVVFIYIFRILRI